MKILIGMTRSDTIVSGSFRHISQMGDEFRKAGADVVYVLGGDGVAHDVLISKGYKVIRLPSLKRNLNVMWDFLALFGLLVIVFKERPNVCSWHTAKIGALGRIASMVLMRKSYYVPHGVPFVDTPENEGHKVYAVVERILSVLPSKIIGVCNFDKKEYLRIGVAGKNVIVIPNGMESIYAEAPSVFRSIDHSDKIKFITAARFEEQKDYETLAIAVESLFEKYGDKFSLEIYGDGFKEGYVKGLFQNAPAGCVLFCGVVSNFSEKLRLADVFILSSHWEGLPRSILEAMSCGKPVVATDVGGNSELIENDETGYLVSHKNSVELAKNMGFYIESPELVEKHGLAGYKKFNEKYTLDKMLCSYVKEYIGVV